MTLPLVLLLGLAADAAPVTIAGVNAKSSYSVGGTTFSATNVKDKKSKPWYEGDPGNGIGSWIEVDLGGTKNVTKIGLFAGDWTSKDSWTRGNRPKEVEVKWTDGTTESWTLEDAWKMAVFTPKTPKSTATIRIKVNQVFNGTTFPDTAISEILVWDDAPDANPVINKVVSSTEFPSDADGTYFAHQAADGISDTFWCEGNKASDGVGETLELVFEKATPVSSVNICAGMCAFGTQQKGNIPTRVTLSFSDGSTQSVDLKVSPLAQTIPLTPRTTSSVKLKIDTVKKGTEFDDACISEVSFTK